MPLNLTFSTYPSARPFSFQSIIPPRLWACEMTLLLMNIINLPPSKCAGTRTCTWSDAPLPLLKVQSQATPPLHQPLAVQTVVSLLCFPFFTCDISPQQEASEWLYHLLAFSFGSPLNLGFLWTFLQSHSDARFYSRTNAIKEAIMMHPIYDTSFLIEL